MCFWNSKNLDLREYIHANQAFFEIRHPPRTRKICSSVGTGSAIRLEQCWDAMNSGENTFKSWTDTMQHGDGMRKKWWSMMKVDGERTRGESERESERERDRESEKERWREKKIERGRERERGKMLFWDLQRTIGHSQKQKTVFLKLSKAKDSYFGVSEATLFETVFEAQKNYKKTKKVSFLRCFESQKELFLKLKNNYFWDCCWDSKKLVLPVFYIVLSFFPFSAR